VFDLVICTGRDTSCHAQPLPAQRATRTTVSTCQPGSWQACCALG
jgi:hypothetical protein